MTFAALAVALVAAAFMAGWYVGQRRAKAPSGPAKGRCGHPLGLGRYCLRRPSRGQQHCSLPGHGRVPAKHRAAAQDWSGVASS